MARNQLNYTIDGTGTASNLTVIRAQKKAELEGLDESVNKELNSLKQVLNDSKSSIEEKNAAREKIESITKTAKELEEKARPSERAVINNFVRRCSSDEVIKAECQIDQDSQGRVSEGITTYSVQTKTSQLITIGIHENNYSACKDQMAVLGNAVQKAKEKIKANRKETVRKSVGGVIITMTVGLSIWAGSIKLSDWFSEHSKNEEPTPVTTEAATEAPTEEITEFATPIDATTEESRLEDKYSADEIRESMEQSNKAEFDKELEELQERRTDLGLNPDSTTPVVNTVENTTETVNTGFQPSYGYSEIVNDAEKTQVVMDEFNEYMTEQQKQELQELRDSYEKEYKMK